MENKNLNKMIEKSIVSNDTNKREEMIKRYTTQTVKDSALIIIGIVIYLLIMLPFLSLSEYPTMLLAIAIILFLIVTFNVGKTIYGTRKIKNELLKAINNNQPLMCFEANVLQINNKKKELPDNRGWHLQPYILLDDEIEIEISNDKCELLNSATNKKIRIYYFEELLKNKNLFDLEVVE